MIAVDADADEDGYSAEDSNQEEPCSSKQSSPSLIFTYSSKTEKFQDCYWSSFNIGKGSQ